MHRPAIRITLRQQKYIVDRIATMYSIEIGSPVYSIDYSSYGGSSFTSLMGGTIDPIRVAAQLRMLFNTDLSQDNVLIDRVALYTHNPYPGLIEAVPEPIGRCPSR